MLRVSFNMEASKTIEEIGKYLNEILGYLLPGVFVNLILFVILDFHYLPLLSDRLSIEPWIFFMISYITGYLIYGVGQAKEKMLSNLNKCFKTNKFICLVYEYFKSKNANRASNELPNRFGEKTKKKISESDEYKFTKDILKTKLPELVKDNISFNNLRNLAMSYCPEADQKIYTFMFRSELSNHIGLVCLFISLWIISANIAHVTFNNTLLIKKEIISKYYIAIIFFLCSRFFSLTKKRFFEIAFKLVFSIFIAKFNPLALQEKKETHV